jgi:hypothetical protein
MQLWLPRLDPILHRLAPADAHRSRRDDPPAEHDLGHHARRRSTVFSLVDDERVGGGGGEWDVLDARGGSDGDVLV